MRLKWRREGQDYVSGPWRIVISGETATAKPVRWEVQRGTDKPKEFDRLRDAKRWAQRKQDKEKAS